MTNAIATITRMNIESLKSKYYTVEEACKLLNVTPGRLRQLRYEKILTGVQLGPRMWWYEKKEVEKYAKERKPAGRPHGS